MPEFFNEQSVLKMNRAFGSSFPQQYGVTLESRVFNCKDSEVVISTDVTESGKPYVSTVSLKLSAFALNRN